MASVINIEEMVTPVAKTIVGPLAKVSVKRALAEALRQAARSLEAAEEEGDSPRAAKPKGDGKSRISDEAKERIREGQKKRWEAKRNAALTTPSSPETTDSGVTNEGEGASEEVVEPEGDTVPV